MRTCGMKRWRLFGIALAFMTLGIASGCSGRSSQQSAEVKRPQVAGVVTETVSPSQVDEYIETSGTVKAKTVSTISSRIMGTVTSVRVTEGDRVSAGQVIALVDDSDIVQRVRAAEKAVEAARQQRRFADATYERYKNLYDNRALTGQELDQVETQKKIAETEYERASAMLHEAQVQLGFTRILAPLSGIVTEKKTDIGNMAVPGMPLFTIEDISAYRIEVNLDERYAGRVKRGTKAIIVIEAANREIQGNVSEVIPSVDPATRTFLVKISAGGEGLRNGSYGKVSIPVGMKEMLLVRKKAVVEKGQLTGVYTVDSSGIVTFRLIRTGRTYGDMVEVLSGLKAAEKIIVDGVDRAADGGVITPETTKK